MAAEFLSEEEINKMFDTVETDEEKSSGVSDIGEDYAQTVSYGKVFKWKDREQMSFAKEYKSPVIKEKNVLYNPEPHQINGDDQIVVKPINQYRMQTG